MTIWRSNQYVLYMSEKCGEYDEAMTYLIWVCCALRNGKLDFSVPCLVVFLFDDLLHASGSLGHNLTPSLPISPTFFSFSLARTTILGDLRWRLRRSTRGVERWLCALPVSLSFCSYLRCCLNLMGSFRLVDMKTDRIRLLT